MDRQDELIRRTIQATKWMRECQRMYIAKREVEMLSAAKIAQRAVDTLLAGFDDFGAVRSIEGEDE